MQLIYATYLSNVSYEMCAKSACLQKDKLFPSTNKLIKKKDEKGKGTQKDGAQAATSAWLLEPGP